jgi:SPP1 family predicted phage head-tail adaptor
MTPYQHRLVLQRSAGTQNAFGEVERDGAEDWVDEATVWADVEPLTGRELFGARTDRNEQPVRIRTRWRSDVTEKKRFKHVQPHGTVFYDITSAPNIGRLGLEVEIMALRRS